MISRNLGAFGGILLLSFAGCSFEHRAPIRAAELPPLTAPVQHSTRIWLELEHGVSENTCISPEKQRTLCFEDLRRELTDALSRALWTTFPRVDVDPRPGEMRDGDYVLHVSLGLEAVPPDATGPGWSAGARGSWRLERMGQTLAGERVASRSRADFPYGAQLGIGAGEVIDAVAVRIGMTLGSVPETHVLGPVPLPAVATSPLSEASTPAAKGEPVRSSL